MKVSAFKYTVLTWVSGFTMVIFALVPFHALLTVWLASVYGHYTAFRLWKEALLLLSVLGVFYLLITDHKIRLHTLSRRLVWLILAYIGLNILWGLFAYLQHDITPKAIGYALIINTRFLVFFLVVWAVAIRLSRLRSHWQKLLLWPAAGVVIFGLLQIFVLPTDFMRHLGYGPSTIPVFETINSNATYVRIASTLRGANPLGAYLIIPINLLAVLIIRNGRNWKQGIFLALSIVVLFFTFSRSAWIGAALSIAILLIMSHLAAKTIKILALGLAILIAILGLSAYLLRDNVHFENLVFHTQDNSSIKVSSNHARLEAIKYGLKDMREPPLGGGPGYAGPASYYNNQKTNISENYFIQIGQEVGWLGLSMFLLINVGVGYLLWLRRDDPLALSLFASLIGITFINLLSHAWTDDTLAYVWWGMAGLAMAPDPRIKSIPENSPETKPAAKSKKDERKTKKSTTVR